MSACQACQNQFSITEDDKSFLEKFTVGVGDERFSIPEPTLCPDCRQRRRLSFRNERALYKRKSDLGGKEIISIYRSDSPYIVYAPDEWWGDAWNPLDDGREIDFSRPFFEQFAQLKRSVPHLGLHVSNNEDSQFVNLSAYNKHCHLIFASEYSQDCLYGTQFIKSEGCIDGLNCLESRYCYEVVDVKDCYQLLYSQDCSNCSDSLFLYNCRNCADCLFSSNLRNKQYHVFNKPCTKDEFLAKKAEVLQQLAAGKLDELRQQFVELKRTTPHKAMSITNSEKSSGNYLANCKNAQVCFDLAYGEDCRYVYTGYDVTDILDVAHTTEAELAYEGTSIGYKSYNTLFCNGAWSSSNVFYCDNIHSCSYLFGCSNLRNAKYCIINKQYEPDEYERLTVQLIKHMQQTGEWGEFFPANLSPFAYEDTTANEYFPAKERIVKYEGETPVGSIVCMVTSRPFNLTEPEKAFYESAGLPLPSRHPDQRHKERMALRPPRKLTERTCSNCGTMVQTPYTKELAEIVYCEDCFLKEVY